MKHENPNKKKEYQGVLETTFNCLQNEENVDTMCQTIRKSLVQSISKSVTA